MCWIFFSLTSCFASWKSCSASSLASVARCYVSSVDLFWLGSHLSVFMRLGVLHQGNRMKMLKFEIKNYNLQKKRKEENARLRWILTRAKEEWMCTLGDGNTFAHLWCELTWRLFTLTAPVWIPHNMQQRSSKQQLKGQLQVAWLSVIPADLPGCSPPAKSHVARATACFCFQPVASASSIFYCSHVLVCSL